MDDEFSKFRWHEHAMRLTKGTASRVAGVMFDRADPDGTRVYVNNLKLAAELGCNERSVRRARKELESLGLAALERRGHNMIGGGSASSEYKLTMPVAQPDIESTAQPDTTTGHLHNRTSVSPQPDIPVRTTGHQCPPNRPVTRPGNKTGAGFTTQPDTEVSGVASLPDGEGQPEMSEPFPWGSVSATADGTSSEDVPQPDTGGVSGVAVQTATGGEQMHDYNPDPWASATADEVDYGALWEEQLAAERRRQEPTSVVLHTGCRDAGPWPEPGVVVDCDACERARV